MEWLHNLSDLITFYLQDTIPPFDAAPATGAPLSLTNISITLGGIKV